MIGRFGLRAGGRMLLGLTVGGALLISGCGTQIQLADPLAAEPEPVVRADSGPRPPSADPTPTPSPTPEPEQPESKPPEPAKEPESTKKSTPKPEKSEQPAEPKPKPILARGDSGNRVRELQARLKQLEWFAESVTGNYGLITSAAVKGFQEKRKLATTGVVDQQTWDALIEMTKKPTKAELTEQPKPAAILADGDSGTRVKQLQARLKQLDWFDYSITGNYGPITTKAVKGFQRKRKLEITGAVDQRTWDALIDKTRKPTAAELADAVPTGSTKGLDRRCLTGRVICISKKTNSLVWLVDGKPRLRMDVRFGSEELPTREGRFSVERKKKDVISNLYHTKMPYSMFFSGGQAVHYSADFAASGYNGASHGCVNVRNWNAIVELYAQARTGDKVIVFS